MDSAVRIFLERRDVLSQRLIAAITKHLDPVERNDDWVAYSLCHDLLSLSPLEINTAQHACFWRIMESIYSQLHLEFGIDMSHDQGRFFIQLNENERTISVSYRQALWLLLRTLVDPRLSEQLRSVHEMPRRLSIIFLKYKGLRRFIVTQLWRNVEDSFNVQDLVHSRQISQKTMDELMAMQTDIFDSGYYETPEHETFERPEPSDCPASQRRPALPSRLAGPLSSLTEAQFCTPSQLHLLCTIYRYLRVKLDHLLNQNTVPADFFRSEFLFSMLHTTLQQTFDNRSAYLPAVSRFYNCEQFEEFGRSIDEVANDVAILLRGQVSPAPELAACRESTAQLAEQLHAVLCSSYPLLAGSPQTTSLRFAFVSCVEIPLVLLISLMEAQYCIFDDMLKLKQHLCTRDRNVLSAYLLDPRCGLLQVEQTLALFRGRVSAEPVYQLENVFVLRTLSRTVLVAEPEMLARLRLLLLLEALPDLGPVCSGDFTLNVFLRVMSSTQIGGKLHITAVHCLASGLAYLIGGRPLRQLIGDVTQTEVYRLYCALPEVLQVIGDVGQTEARSALAAFLGLKACRLSVSSEAVRTVEQNRDAFIQDPSFATGFLNKHNSAQKLKHRCLANEEAVFQLEDDSESSQSSSEWNTFKLGSQYRSLASFYTAIMSARTLMIEESFAALLFGLRPLKTKLNRVRRRLASNPDDAPLTGLRPTDNLSRLVRFNESLLSDANSKNLNCVQVNMNVATRRQLSNRRTVGTRLTYSLPDPAVLKKFLQIELNSRGGLENAEEVFSLDRFVRDDRFAWKLRIDGLAGLDFEDSIAMACPAVGAFTGPPDTLLGTPIQNVLNVDVVGELALTYHQEWQTGRLLNNTAFAGCYSNYMRAVLDNEVLDVQQTESF